jgi:peptide/nickel transport system substrate-binding protein
MLIEPIGPMFDQVFLIEDPVDLYGLAYFAFERFNQQEDGMRLKRVLLLIIAAGVLMFPVGQISARTPKDMLIVAVPTTPPGIDIDIHSQAQAWEIMANVFDTSAWWKKVPYPFGDAGAPDVTYPLFDRNQLQPRLFESWELSADGRVATFRIRPGVKSYYGNEFTTEDVKWRIDRLFGLKAVGTFLALTQDFASADALKVIDRYTFSITAARPNPLLIDELANSYWTWFDSTVAKKHATADDPWAMKWLATNDAAFGPYHIEQWVAGSHILLVANPNFWAGPPAIKRVLYRVVPESANRMAMVINGDVDIAVDLTPQEYSSLRNRKGVRVVDVRNNSLIWIHMNNQLPPFNDRRVRQALNYATPREAIIKSVFFGMGRPWKGVIPSIFPGFTDEYWSYDTDLQKAQELIKAAGYPNGFDATLSYQATEPNSEKIAILMQTTLKTIGINLTLNKMTPGPFTERIMKKEMPFAIWQDIPIQPDVNYALTLPYDSSSFINYGNYANPKINEILKVGRSIVDPETRSRFHQEAQRIILEDAPLIFLIEPGYQMAMRDNIKGFSYYTCRYMRFDDLIKE